MSQHSLVDTHREYIRKENAALSGSNTVEGIEQPAEREGVNVGEIFLVPVPPASAAGAGRGLILIIRLGVGFLLILILVLVLGARDRAGKGRVKVLEKDNATRGNTTHERGESRVINPGRRQRDDVDIEHELAGKGVDERRLARPWNAIQQIATTEGDAPVRIPLYWF